MSFSNFIAQHPKAFLTTVGATSGAAAGAVRGYLTKSHYDVWRDETHHYSKEQRKRHALIAGAAMGVLGGAMGYSSGKKIPPFTPRAAQSVPGPFKGVRSKEEVKKLVREFSLKHHPDRGGDAKKFREFVDAYNAFKKHPKFPKTAMAAFVDEMVQILGQ